MKTKRDLRVSGHKDYVAVDIVDENGKIKATPFYIKTGETIKVKYFDNEETQWVMTDAKINPEFTAITFRDISGGLWDGLEWDSEFSELINETLVRFI